MTFESVPSHHRRCIRIYPFWGEQFINEFLAHLMMCVAGSSRHFPLGNDFLISALLKYLPPPLVLSPSLLPVCTDRLSVCIGLYADNVYRHSISRVMMKLVHCCTHTIPPPPHPTKLPLHPGVHL
jgi:hypothetical protein